MKKELKEILKDIQTYLVDKNDEESIKLMEDATDSLKDVEISQEAKDSLAEVEKLRSELAELDKSWSKRYRDRFLGKIDEEIEREILDSEALEEMQEDEIEININELTIDEMFVNDDDKEGGIL